MIRSAIPLLVIAVLTAVPPARGASAGEEQELVFRLAVPAEAALGEVLVEVQRPDDPRQLALVDDGTVAGDLPHDGIYTGRDRGAYARLLPVRVSVSTPDGTPTVAYEGLVQTVDARQDAVSWRLVAEPGGWIATPTAVAYPGRTAASAGAIPTALALVWGALVIGLVAWIYRGRTRAGGDGS